MSRDDYKRANERMDQPTVPRIPMPQFDVSLKTPTPVDPKYVRIQGVLLPKGLLNSSKGQKSNAVNGRWRLSTRSGKVIAEFETELELDEWWQFFHRSQGRTPKPLLVKVLYARSSEGEGGVSFTPNALDGPLKPWSEKYDMPEFDCE